VNLKRVSKQLRREAAAHPKKAGILGLLCLVALWFWAPLVWRWIDKEDTATKASVAGQAATSAPRILADVPVASAAAPNKSESPKYPWHQVAQWMDNDPRTTATNPLPGRRDPFLASPTEAATARLEAERGEALVEATPEGLGMVLSSTIVGPHRRVAQINGKPYRLGETVRLAKDGQQIDFTLAAVYPRRIVLERKGEQFELKIPSPAHSGRIELFGSGD
jgi:hypothetical protein